MTPNRLRWGALAWVLTLQFFVVETVAQLRFDGPYSRVDDVISDLGTAESPAATLMNASFVVQGVLIGAGVLLLRPVLLRTAGEVASILLGAAAVGVLLVGVFPSDGNSTLHAIGAVLHLLGGGLGLIALAYAVRPRSEALGTTLALLGLVGTATTVFFLTGVVGYLGEGGTERVAAYVVPIGLAAAGIGLWRLGQVTADDARSDEDRPSRREERAQERELRAQRARERNEALEASVERPAPPEPDDDEEDPWAPQARDRD